MSVQRSPDGRGANGQSQDFEASVLGEEVTELSERGPTSYEPPASSCGTAMAISVFRIAVNYRATTSSRYSVAMRKRVIGVMGGGDAASVKAMEWGYQLGQMIAQRNWVLLSGGRNTGVMDSACRGASDAGGLVIGIMPGDNADDASEAVDIAVVTAMGSARNNINVLSSDVVIACGDASPGTLSEIALALKAKRHVIFLNDDEQARSFLERAGAGLVHLASDPQAAMALADQLLPPPAEKSC